MVHKYCGAKNMWAFLSSDLMSVKSARLFKKMEKFLPFNFEAKYLQNKSLIMDPGPLWHVETMKNLEPLIVTFWWESSPGESGPLTSSTLQWTSLQYWQRKTHSTARWRCKERGCSLKYLEKDSELRMLRGHYQNLGRSHKNSVLCIITV